MSNKTFLYVLSNGNKMEKSKHKLSKTLQTMTKDDLKEVYELMWKDGDKYTVNSRLF